MFHTTMSIDEVEREEDKKPSAYMLNTIVKSFGVLPTDTLYIGDGETDVEMARNAGVKPIVVLTGNLNKTEAKKLNVEVIIPSIKNLTELNL